MARKAALILAWGLYDLANQFFAINVISLYFVRWLTIERAVPEIFYSITFCISTFLVAISAPILGGISDTINRRMPFLISLTLLSIIFTMLLGVSENVFVALLFFAIANFGCQGAIVFYNALMVNIAPKDKIGLVSGFGRMLGYSGAVLALYLIKPIVLKSGYRAAFLPTGILFLIFALPCMIFIKDPVVSIEKSSNKSKNGVVKKDKILESPGLSDFLKAAFFCLCVVNTIILFMSVYATRVFRLDEAQVINLITFATFFAMAGSFISGYISDRVGACRSFLAVIILWEISLLTGAFAKNANLYWLIGALAGVALGSTWTVARALALRIVSGENIGAAFGLFNFVGYLSAIAGSIFWGVSLLVFSRLQEVGYRVTLFNLSLFLVFAFVFLLRVNRTEEVNL